jgi:hypothetical protein
MRKLSFDNAMWPRTGDEEAEHQAAQKNCPSTKTRQSASLEKNPMELKFNDNVNRETQQPVLVREAANLRILFGSSLFSVR